MAETIDPQAEAAAAAAHVDAASRLIGLAIDPAHRPGVATCMVLIRRMATLVMALPLDPVDEPAPVFDPAAGTP